MISALLSLATRFPFFRELARETLSLRHSAAANPIRGKLLNTEQLEQHARTIATEHRTVRQRMSVQLLQREINQYERQLRQSYQQLSTVSDQWQPVAPAAEWLLDNFYVVIDQIEEIRVDLPQGYYQQLPKLQDGPYRKRPRVYALAIELISHTDGRIDLEQLLRFITAYQSVNTLTMGELWAVAIMLRVCLVANLSQLAHSIVERHRLQREADEWAERLLASKKGSIETGNVILFELQQQYTPLPPSFAARLIRRLRIHEDQRNPALVLEWIESRIIEQYGSLETLSHVENQQQVMLQTAVGNTITSMRTLNSIQWKEWFEHLSLVEQILRRDPAGVYARSTFATRDQYRHEIERLARDLPQSEDDVARLLVAYAGRLSSDTSARYRHIGYYLLDEGRSAFETHLAYRSPPVEAAQRMLMRDPTVTYLGTLTGCTAALLAAGTRLLLTRQERQTINPALQLVLTTSMFFPASALAKGLVDYVLTLLLQPRVLPRLDLSDGIPADLRTIVVIPTLLLTRLSHSMPIHSFSAMWRKRWSGHWPIRSTRPRSTHRHARWCRAMVSSSRA